MSCVVLKVEFEKELRRVAVERTVSFACLKQKLATMFSFADTDSFIVSSRDNDRLVRIGSDEDCKVALHNASQKNPPVLRLLMAKAPFFLCHNCDNERTNTSYFKCLNCFSYELCEACAAEGCHAEHMLVKLHQSVDSFSRQQQLVFLKHIVDPAEKVIAKKRIDELREEKRKTKEEAQKKEAVIEELQTIAAAETNPLVKGNLNVSLLMSEFQEVVPDLTKPAEPSIEKEIATWDIVSEPELKAAAEAKPTELAPPAEAEERKDTEEEKNKKQPNPFKANLEALEQMGFCDREKNIKLLVKHVNDLEAAVEELLHTRSWFFPDAFSKFGL